MNSEVLLEALLGQPHGLAVFRLEDGAIAACSEGALAQFGPGVTVGQKFAALLDPGSLSKLTSALTAAEPAVWELQLGGAGEGRLARFLVVPTAPRAHVVVAAPFGLDYCVRLEQQVLAANAELATRARELSRRAAEFELHSVIVRNLAEGVCLVRAADLTIVYANPRFEQIFGYEPGELTGRSVATLGPADADPEVEARRRLEILGGAVGPYELHNRRKDGSTVWCRGRASAFMHPRHGLVWVVVEADVSAEKEAADRLRRQEKLLQTVIDILPVGVWVADAEGRIVSGNPAGRRIWAGARYVGIEQFGEYQGWWADSGKPISVDEWAVARAIRRGESAVGELIRIRCFDGSYKTILNSAIPLRDGDAIVGAVAVNEDVTRLMEAQALFSGVVAAAPDAIVATDGGRRITVFNAGAERIFACERRDVIGCDVASLVAEQHRTELDALLRAAESRGLIEPRLFTARRRSGHTFPAEASVASTVTGGLRCYTLVVRDVTARVEAEEERARLMRALGDERTWLRSLITTAPMGVLTFDAEGRMTYNRRAEELLDGTLAEDAHESAHVVARRADGVPLAVEELPASRVRRGERMFAEEFLFVHRNGARSWVLGSAAPVVGAGGQRIGAIGIFEDISAQKRQEEEQRFLARAGQMFSRSLDYEETLQVVARFAVPVLADGCVVWLVGEDGEVRPAALHCDDPGQTQVLEESLRRHAPRGGQRRVVAEPELVPSLAVDDWRQQVRDPEHFELLRRSGARSGLTVPLTAREEVIGRIDLFQARSGRSMGSRDLPLAEALGQRAGLAIDNARLYRAARTATQARDDLLAVVAHDLRNPLGTIVMGVEWLADRLPEDDREARAAVEGIVRSAQRIDRLIQDLLDATQLERGSLTMSPGPLDPAEIVEEAIAAARPLAGGRALVVDVSPSLPPVWADRHRILQVLSNLLGNALKFTPPVSRVVVAAERRGDQVLFRVTDNGPGIAPAQIPHVFDRFWRGSPPDRRGVGLGLAIVKGIVEAHAGRVWVESQPGAGATFLFTLPIAPAPVDAEICFKEQVE